MKKMDETNTSVENDSGVSRELPHIPSILARQKGLVLQETAYLC